jgi:hypothetical protein
VNAPREPPRTGATRPSELKKSIGGGLELAGKGGETAAPYKERVEAFSRGKLSDSPAKPPARRRIAMMMWTLLLGGSALVAAVFLDVVNQRS